MELPETPQNAPTALVAPRTRPLLWISRAHQTALDLIGLPFICEMIIGGSTQTEIGRALGIPQQALAAWLVNQDAPGASMYTLALRTSAETMLDRGYAAICEADPTVPGSVQLAKLKAEHHYRVAGIRNRAYRERTTLAETLAEAQHEATGGNGGQPGAPTVSFTITIAPQRDDGRQPLTIEHDPG